MSYGYECLAFDMIEYAANQRTVRRRSSCTKIDRQLKIDNGLNITVQRHELDSAGTGVGVGQRATASMLET